MSGRVIGVAGTTLAAGAGLLALALICVTLTDPLRVAALIAAGDLWRLILLAGQTLATL